MVPNPWSTMASLAADCAAETPGACVLTCCPHPQFAIFIGLVTSISNAASAMVDPASLVRLQLAGMVLV
eukprot:3645687-Rhodomonas_salina.2